MCVARSEATTGEREGGGVVTSLELADYEHFRHLMNQFQANYQLDRWYAFQLYLL